MSKSEYKKSKDLPLFTAIVKLLSACDLAMNSCDKDHKHTFGREMIILNFTLLKLLSKAKRSKILEDRLDIIDEMLDIYNTLAYIFKYLSEGKRFDKTKGKVIQFIPEEIYVEAIPLLANVERQLTGWYNKTYADIQCQSSDGTEESIHN